MMDKTRIALAWLADDPTRTAYQASKRFKVNQSTIGRAIAREGLKVKCPTCGNFGFAPKQVPDDGLPRHKNGRINVTEVLRREAEEEKLARELI